MSKPLTPLEDATLRFVRAHVTESDGWLDLTRVASRTARMLPDIRQAVERLARRGLVQVDADAPNTERWIRFCAEGAAAPAAPAPPDRPVP